MKNVLLLVLVTAISAQAQQPPPTIDGQVMPLWTGAAPGALGSDESDIPAMTVYLPRTMSCTQHRRSSSAREVPTRGWRRTTKDDKSRTT